MNQILIIGTVIVTFALIAYSIAIFTEQKRSIVNKQVLIFLSIGLLFDITATIFMIVGSANSPFTLHGFIGYSSLSGMLLDTILIWRLYILKGHNSPVHRKLHIYSRIAYIWWVLAYITGGLLVVLN